jgi:hypothetical protein
MRFNPGFLIKIVLIFKSTPAGEIRITRCNICHIDRLDDRCMHHPASPDLL